MTRVRCTHLRSETRCSSHSGGRAALWCVRECCAHVRTAIGAALQVYYKEAVGAIVVYDVNRAPTFEAVKKWKNDIDNKVMIPTGMIPTILLANKCDLLKDPVDKAELMKFCADNDFKGW